MTTKTTQYPQTIYATADTWGSDTSYETYESMQNTIASLKDAGGEDWNGIDISDCEKFDFVGMHGEFAIYRQSLRGGEEYFAFTRNDDDEGTFVHKNRASGFTAKTLTVAQAAYEIGLPFTHEQAAARVAATPELVAHEATILADWEDDTHYGWVCSADVAEIVDWAKSVERDGDPA